MKKIKKVIYNSLQRYLEQKNGKRKKYQNEKVEMKQDDEVEIKQDDEVETEKDIDYTQELLLLLKENKRNIEICEKLKIGPQKLNEELLKLKNMGLEFERLYYANGTVKYKTIKKRCLGFQKRIISPTEEENMKIMAISDLHFGSNLERPDLVDHVFNYCIKNGIHIIICCGDFVDGMFAKLPQKITDPYKQLEYFIKRYPSDKSILTFGVAGNHDESLLKKASLNIIEACNNARQDIIIGGYNNAKINIKRDQMHLFHRLNKGKMVNTNAPIILHGHSHQYITDIKNNTLHIVVPALSNINQPFPTALELNLSFQIGYIRNVQIKNIYFGSKQNGITEDIIISETKIDIPSIQDEKPKESEKSTGAPKILQKTNNHSI